MSQKVRVEPPSAYSQRKGTWRRPGVVREWWEPLFYWGGLGTGPVRTDWGVFLVRPVESYRGGPRNKCLLGGPTFTLDTKGP